MTNEEFVMHVHGIAARARADGAPISPLATACHGAHESAFGRSELASEGRNLFGIKLGGSWSGQVFWGTTWEVIDGEWVRFEGTNRVYASATMALSEAEGLGVPHERARTALFRAYDDFERSVADYGALIGRVYPHAAQHNHDPKAFLEGLFKTGPYKWATDPDIFDKVWSYVQIFRSLVDEEPANLGDFDPLVWNTPVRWRHVREVFAAWLGARPAVFREGVVASRTYDGIGAPKLDIRVVEE